MAFKLPKVKAPTVADVKRQLSSAGPSVINPLPNPLAKVAEPILRAFNPVTDPVKRTVLDPLGDLGTGIYTAVSGSVGKAGRDVSTEGKKVIGATKAAPDKIFGNAHDPGILGTGMFQPESYGTGREAFYGHQGLDNLGQSFKDKVNELAGRQAFLADNTSLDPASLAAAARINTQMSGQVRGQQMGLAQMLTAAAQGNGPSVAQNQLRQATDRNLSQALALAATNPTSRSLGGLGLRQLRQQQSGLNQQAASDAAILRAQEQMAARDALAGVLSGLRASDIGLETGQAGLEQQATLANQAAENAFRQKQADLAQQTALANQAARISNRSQADEQTQAYNQALQDVINRAADQEMAYEKLRTDQKLEEERLRQAAFSDAAKLRAGIASNIGQGIATVVSDKRLKNMSSQNDSTEDLEKFLSLFSVRPLQPRPKVEVPSIGTSKNELAQMTIGKGIGGLIDTAIDKLPSLGAYRGGVIPGLATVEGDSPLNDTTQLRASPGEAVVPRSAMADPKKLDEFVSKLKAHMYTYKNKKHGDGVYISPMAQELEKSDLGRSMVVGTPEGKVVDYGRAGGLMLATAAHLNQKMKDLEGAFKAMKGARRAG